MRLDRIQLNDFRNYTNSAVSFNEGVNIFVGENAQGKTSLLESIYMLSLARSHRTSNEKEMIQWQCDFSRINGHLVRRYDTVDLELTLTKKGKSAKINGLTQQRLSDYVGVMNVILFAPEDLELVKGSPQMRRRFIDIELSQMDPIYLHEYLQYQRLLKQRNTYLKQLSRREVSDILYLEVLTEQFVEHATSILIKRQQFIKKLETLAAPIHKRISNNKESLSLIYYSSIPLTEQIKESQLKLALLEKFKKIKEREIERGITLLGPHREDLKFAINDRDVQQFGSQGQQRTTVLSLKLAEIECMKLMIGEYPILLLDDVLSELDSERQSHLLSAIQRKVQTFLTTTNTEGIEKKKMLDVTLFKIKNGQVNQREERI